MAESTLMRWTLSNSVVELNVRNLNPYDQSDEFSLSATSIRHALALTDGSTPLKTSSLADTRIAVSLPPKRGRRAVPPTRGVCTMSFLKRIFGRGCSHRFAWPRFDNGRHYQICLTCGIAYEYDWSKMHATSRLVDANPQARLGSPS